MTTPLYSYLPLLDAEGKPVVRKPLKGEWFHDDDFGVTTAEFNFECPRMIYRRVEVTAGEEVERASWQVTPGAIDVELSSYDGKPRMAEIWFADMKDGRLHVGVSVPGEVAATADTACKLAFAEMEIADTHRPDGDLPFDGHEELWMRFMRDGERTPELVSAMQALTTAMAQGAKA